MLEPYQNKAVNQLLTKPRGILLAGCGAGKTYMALEIMNRIAGNILLITPLNLHNAWYKLTKMNFPKKIDEFKPGINCINREKSHIVNSDFKCVIIDESSLFKSVGGVHYKRIWKLCSQTKYVYIMTGTIYGNHLLDVYGQMNLIDRSVLKNKGHFLDTYMDFDRMLDYHIPLYKMNKEKFFLLLNKVKPFITSVDTCDIKTPPYKFLVLKGSLPYGVQKIIDKIHNAHMQEKMDLVVTNSAVLANKKHQIVSGGYYDFDKEYVHLHDERVKFIRKVVKKTDRLIVYYNYLFELALLKKEFPNGVEFSTDNIDLWNAKEIKLMFIPSKSGSHGLNLQEGGDSLAYFSLPYSAEIFIQGVSRLVRRGQKGNVKIYISILHEVDEKIYETLNFNLNLAHYYFSSVLKND